jgi:hypothetical protein
MKKTMMMPVFFTKYNFAVASVHLARLDEKRLDVVSMMSVLLNMLTI